MPTFQLKPEFLTQAVSLDVEGTAPSIAMLSANQAPGAQAVTIASENISVSGGTTVHFKSIGPGVTFNAGESAKIEILPNPASLTPEITNGLDLADQLTPALSFPAAPSSHYGLLRWGYDIGPAMSGSVALAPEANLKFAADGSRAGLYAVVRLIEDGPGCADIVRALVSSWRLPNQVQDIADLPPGTWIIAEINGSASWSVNATYGYNLNWIRAATLGPLKGDIGLKVQIGLAADLGFKVSGKHAVILSRGTGAEQNQIRLRLYRIGVREWDFGFSASATAQAVDSLLPAKFDDLIAGALGVSGTKIVAALKDLDVWTNPSQPLFGPLSNVSEQYFSDFIGSITGFDFNTELPKIKAKIQSFVSFWNNLPQETTKLLWSYIPDSNALGSIAGLAKQISGAKETDLASLLADKLKNVAFFNTPEGKWLESLASNDLFTALTASGDLGRIQSYAAQASKLLDGSDLQSFLTKLHDEISSRLDLAKLETIVDQASVANLDQWLAVKLQDFLGKKNPATLKELLDLRGQIHNFAAMRNTFYQKALAALNEKYSFSLSATYQNTATGTALIDAVFDFSGTNGPDARACLASALNGDLQTLTRSDAGHEHPSLMLNQGVLTHGVRRQSTVDLTLPYYKESTQHVNDVLSSITDIDNGEGRLLAVKATDTLTISQGRNQRDSALTLAVSLQALGQSGVVIHEPPTVSCSYSLTDKFDNMSLTRFSARYTPEIESYFGNLFQPAPMDQNIDKWVKQLTAGGIGLGQGTVSLQATVPPDVLRGWMKAPAPSKAPIYKTMATTLIRKFRELLLQQYFADPNHYNDVADGSASFVLLAYSSVPILNDAHLDTGDGQLILNQDNNSGKLYWDYREPELRKAMLVCPPSIDQLQAKLSTIQAFLKAEGNRNAQFYEETQAARMIQTAMKHPGTPMLFGAESTLVDDARSAGMKIAQFLASEGSQQDVQDELEAFGAKLTKTFNTELRTWATDSLLLPLGPVLLIEAARVFDNAAANIPSSAMFTVQAKNVPGSQRLTRIPPPAA